MNIIIYDFGTSSVKTCLFRIGSEIRLTASASAGYTLYVSDDGGAEQDTEEWWNAICSTTRNLFQACDVNPGEINGLAFTKSRCKLCGISQCQGYCLEVGWTKASER